jgi:hypothetical protein
MAIFLIFLFSFLFPKNCLALNDFTATQSVNYQIGQDGGALVKKTVSLTNNYSEIYPQKYQITLYDTNITDISATDNDGSIVDSVDYQDELTIINLKLNQPKAGKGQINQFDIRYKLPQLAQKKGKIWEIPLPYQKNSDFVQNQITLTAPENFGRLSFSSLPPKQHTTLNQTHTLIFNQDQNSNQKILLTFGDFQVFDFSLDYYLANSSTSAIQEQIAIPPDTNTQKIIYRQISPPPQNIVIDTDGNWLAQYQIPPQQEIKITVEGQVKISPLDSSAPQIKINQEQLISNQKYWPVADPKIKQISLTLSGPRQIYDYVVDHLNYNYQQIDFGQRQGALFALENPNLSLCTEFTDLFITLARAKGIPAREVEGYAYTNNPKIKPVSTTTDILHAWPQYFDSQQQLWRSIDPTWAKTTNGIDYFSELDLNHFAFVFHGQDSLFPPPPGSYKNQKVIKTININFSQEELDEQIQVPQISLENNSLVVKNPQLRALHQLSISLPDQNWQHLIEVLPPLASIIIPPPLPRSFFSFLPKNKNYQFDISAQNQTLGQVSIEKPQHLPQLIVSLILFFILLLVSGIILKRLLRKP